MAAKRAQGLKEVQKLVDARRYDDAARALHAMLVKRPRDVSLYVALARLLTRRMKRYEDSVRLCEKALAFAPKNVEVLQEAAEANFLRDRVITADRYAAAFVAAGSSDPRALAMAAEIFQQVGKFAEANAVVERALTIRPDHLASRVLHARTLRSLGRFDEAVAVARAILNEHPNNAMALGVYIEAQKIREGDPVIAHLEENVVPQLRAQNQNKPLGRILMSLGKARLDLGKHEEAFELFREGRDISDVGHDRATMRNYVSGIKRGVSRADFFAPLGADDERPVLIVGLPRVGSTLLEQVLDSHPQIGGVGESGSLRGRLFALRIPERDGPAMAAGLRGLSAADAAQHAGVYLDQTAARHPGARRVIDKNLHNFELLGLFTKLFPKGRIIHALRDPLDHCVACYLRSLPEGHSYLFDLSALGQYYREHRELMEHWKAVLPTPILEVRYEDMVADTEAKAREVIDFLGLEWDDACMNYRTSEHRINTASVWQARQPVYTSSVKRWKRYEKFLDPLKKELGVFYPDGFDA